MKSLYLIIPLLLLGCSDGPVTVSLNIVSQAEVIAVAHAHGGDPEREDYAGYAVWNGEICDIYVVSREECCEIVNNICDDEGVRDYVWNQVLGHELRHCFYGDYHE